jgi:hypothetical protein
MKSGAIPKAARDFLDARINAFERLSDGPKSPEDENPKQSD